MASLVILAGVSAHSAIKKHKENKNNATTSPDTAVVAQRSSEEVPPPYVVPPEYTADSHSDTPLVVLDPTAANPECAAHGHDVQRYYAIYPYALLMPRTRPCRRCGEECSARMCLFSCHKKSDRKAKSKKESAGAVVATE